MANITAAEAQAWLESTKLDLGGQLDSELESSIASQVLAQVATAYDVSSWVDANTTPTLIRKIIAMLYAAWTIDKEYDQTGDKVDPYAERIRQTATLAIQGIITGAQALTDVSATSADEPVFYPTDNSSALEPTTYDTSLGDAAFSMGKVF